MNDWLPHREYHCRMLLKAIQERKNPPGDTRVYLDIDEAEAEILTELLWKELND